MKPGYTDITIVLDRSGSMESIASDVIGGQNKFIADQKAVPGECTLTLVQFDHEYQVVHSAVPIANVPDLTSQTYTPRGQTALLDAMGRSINEAGRRFGAMAESDRPEHVIFVISTDGLENNSHEFSREQIASMVKLQTDVYKWHFVYLGANQDAIAVAGGMGISPTNAMSYVPTSGGVAQYCSAVGANTAKMRTGASASMGFTRGQRQEQEEEAAKVGAGSK